MQSVLQNLLIEERKTYFQTKLSLEGYETTVIGVRFPVVSRFFLPNRFAAFNFPVSTLL